jgi:hypothetical protein
MAKLIDSAVTREGIGNEALLRFIDEINVRRAGSYQRRRFKPYEKLGGVLGMIEWDAIPRPNRADTPSPRYTDAGQVVPFR